MSRIPLQLTGKKFNRLLIISKAGRNKHGAQLWWCECDCGEYIILIKNRFINGDTKSCGCFNRMFAKIRSQQLKLIATTHGQSKTVEYQIWIQIKGRCFNKNNKAFKNYGGRGISICKRWLNFNNFIIDMGKRPNSKYTIERTNNEKGYSPENCIWATKTIQARNRRLPKDSKTGHIGISWCKKTKKYRAYISLGNFNNISDAIAARKNAEIKCWNKSDG